MINKEIYWISMLTIVSTMILGLIIIHVSIYSVTKSKLSTEEARDNTLCFALDVKTITAVTEYKEETFQLYLVDSEDGIFYIVFTKSNLIDGYKVDRIIEIPQLPYTFAQEIHRFSFGVKLEEKSIQITEKKQESFLGYYFPHGFAVFFALQFSHYGLVSILKTKANRK